MSRQTLSHFAHSSVCVNITCILRIPLMSNGWLLTTVTKCRADIAACSGCTSWCGRASRLRLCWPAGSWGNRPSGRSLANLAGCWWWRWWWRWCWNSGSLFTSWWPYRDGGKRPKWRKGEASLEDDSVERRGRGVSLEFLQWIVSTVRQTSRFMLLHRLGLKLL